jgi:hypothetical protein
LTGYIGGGGNIVTSRISFFWADNWMQIYFSCRCTVNVYTVRCKTQKLPIFCQIPRYMPSKICCHYLIYWYTLLFSFLFCCCFFKKRSIIKGDGLYWMYLKYTASTQHNRVGNKLLNADHRTVYTFTVHLQEK